MALYVNAQSIYLSIFKLLVCRAVPSVCLLPDVRRHGPASPLTSHITKGERTVVALSYHEVRGGAISPRPLKQRTARSRRQANSSGDIAARRLPLCACRARLTARCMSRQIQANSRGDQDGTDTASARRTSVAFASRNRTPLIGLTVWSLPANTLGLQTMEQSWPRPA